MPGSADVERFDGQSLAAQQMQLVKTRDDRRGVKLQRRPEARDVLSSVAISPIDPSPLFLSPKLGRSEISVRRAGRHKKEKAPWGLERNVSFYCSNLLGARFALRLAQRRSGLRRLAVLRW